MPNIRAAGYNAPKPQRVNGDTVALVDTATVSANFSAGETCDFLIPAGTQIVDGYIDLSDLDTGTSILFRVGYAPVVGGTVTAVDDYFAPAGQTTAQTGGRLRFVRGAPIVFQEDVNLRITFNAGAGTFQAGTITAAVFGNQVGVR